MVRVLVAEALAVVRAGTTALLEREPDVDVVGEVDDGRLVVPMATRTAPDVVLMGLGLRGHDGARVTSDMATALPRVRVLILTGSQCPTAFRRALAAGAHGYLRKDASVAALLHAIRVVASGGHCFDPDLAVAAVRVGPSPLRLREEQALKLVADGASVAECARHLHLAEGTVRNVLRAAVTRLDARNRVDAIRVARANGWIDRKSVV